MTEPSSIRGVPGAARQADNRPQPAKQPGAPSFAEAYARAQAASPAGVQFSSHAQKRLEKREIEMNDERVMRLSDAVDKAEKRGGKSSLVLVDDLAFIVNVRERLVITAMDTKERGEGVFSQIDTVVFAAPAED